MPELAKNYPKKKYRVHRKDRQGKHRRQYNTGSTVWRRIREQQLTKQPFCVDCSTDEALVPANTVDHIDGNAWNNSMDNLQSMCVSCHSRKTVREDMDTWSCPGNNT